MFAFGLWDSIESVLWLVRDRIGIKPLYFATVNGRVAFASEIKALLALPGIGRSINHEALYHYLSFLTAPAPLTLFDGIYKLPPATRMRISSDGRIDQARYWDVWENTQPLVDVADADIAERLIGELRTSVN